MLELDAYWISALVFLGYILVFTAYWIWKRKRILERRGIIQTAYVVKKWIVEKVTQSGTKKGETYYYQYRFEFENEEYKIDTTSKFKSDWNALNVNSPVEIIFDPQNPQQYNIPTSSMGEQSCGICMFLCLSISWILGLGLGIGIGVYQFKFIDILMTSFVIPGGTFIVIWLSCCLCCPSCRDHGGSLNKNYSDDADKDQMEMEIQVKQ